MVIDITIDQITEGKTVVKAMVIETRTMADPGIEKGGIGVAPEKAPNPEAVPKIDMKTEGRVEMMPEIDRSESRSRSSSCVSTNRDRSRWHKILVKHTIQMFDRSGTNVAQISVFSHICLQYISHT